MNSAIEIAIRLPRVLPDQRQHRDVNGKRQQRPDHEIDGEGDEALAVVGDVDRHRHAFGRDDLALAPAAALEELCRAFVGGQQHQANPASSSSRALAAAAEIDDP